MEASHAAPERKDDSPKKDVSEASILYPDRNAKRQPYDPSNPHHCAVHYRLYWDQDALFPYDEDEKSVHDIYHRLFKSVFHEQMHLAPVIPHEGETRILSVGAGTAIWAIEMASKFPEAKVVALQKERMQPTKIAAVKTGNVHLVHVDINEPWNIVDPPRFQSRRKDYDFVHIRKQWGMIRDLPALYRQTFEHLRPGGHLEHVEMDWNFGSYEEVPFRSVPIQAFCSDLETALQQAGVSFKVEEVTPSLEDAGFVDVVYREVIVDTSPGETEPSASNAARWANLAIACSCEAMFLVPATRVLGKPIEEAIEMLKDFQANVCRTPSVAYTKIHTWTARKPEAS